MRPCGANYENQCSSKWVAHGGGLRGTCKEGLGVEVPWVPWHTEQQHTALTVAVQPTAIHHRTCRQVTDGPCIPTRPALTPPGIKAGFPPKASWCPDYLFYCMSTFSTGAGLITVVLQVDVLILNSLPLIHKAGKQVECFLHTLFACRSGDMR